MGWRMTGRKQDQGRAGRDGTAPAGGAGGGDAAISILARGMQVQGDVVTEGTVRVEGRLDGTVKAAKAVVVGKEGVVEGDIRTQDALIAGRVVGTITAESRLEVQDTAVVEGEVTAHRLQLAEGAVLNGAVAMGDGRAPSPKGGDEEEKEEDAVEGCPEGEEPESKGDGAPAGEGKAKGSGSPAKGSKSTS